MASTAASTKWDATTVRKTFVDFFEKENEHTFVASSSVVPYEDPTLLFVNSGMVQVRALSTAKFQAESVQCSIDGYRDSTNLSSWVWQTLILTLESSSEPSTARSAFELAASITASDPSPSQQLVLTRCVC
jgi:hypothetical protein